jgi:ADP-ribose pyrophosphatase YjhB (NUDIX family)
MAERLFQVGIKGLIRDNAGKILLLEIPKGTESYWDLPGGRMDEGETFKQTLARELREEIDCDYVGEPKHLMTVVSNITIPVGDSRVGLILMAFEVTLADNYVITLNDVEIAYAWYTPSEASKLLANKYPPDFTYVIDSL